MIDFVYANWHYILICVIAILLLTYGILTGKVIHWLRWAVSEAEKELGSGTGQLKLHKVYDMFLEKFPGFATIVPFTLFSLLVDNALDWMKEQLDKNENIKNTITGA